MGDESIYNPAYVKAAVVEFLRELVDRQREGYPESYFDTLYICNEIGRHEDEMFHNVLLGVFKSIVMATHHTPPRCALCSDTFREEYLSDDVTQLHRVRVMFTEALLEDFKEASEDDIYALFLIEMESLKLKPYRAFRESEMFRELVGPGYLAKTFVK